MVIGLLATPGMARAQSWLYTPGVLGTATVAVGHATLKLPPGDWAPVSERTANPVQNGGQSLDMQTKWLAQTSDGHLVAMVAVSSNITRSAAGWRADAQCRRRDVVFFANASETNKNFDCMMVNHEMMQLGDNPSDFWATTLAKLKSMGSVPNTMLCAQFALASGSRLDFLDVRVCVNPVLAGLPDDAGHSWAGSDWNKHNIAADHRAFVSRMMAWAIAYRQTVANAF